MNNKYEDIIKFLDGTGVNYEEGTTDDTEILCVDLSDSQTITIEEDGSSLYVSLLTEESRDGDEISYNEEESQIINSQEEVIDYLKGYIK